MYALETQVELFVDILMNKSFVLDINANYLDCSVYFSFAAVDKLYFYAIYFNISNHFRST